MKQLNQYEKIVGKEITNEIKEKAEKIAGKHILMVNSTYVGGGVAELLKSFVIILNEEGIKVGWRIILGNPDFFTITKKFHNALQGEKINLSERKKKMYTETNQKFSVFTHLDHDLVIVHDPQPLPLISFYKKTQPWIFRCHIDISNPYPPVWDYLKKFIEKYDHAVVSKEEYIKDLKIPQSIIHPAIDPLSTKNKHISDNTITKYLSKHGIDRNKPIVSQISRFDKWKDPLGVVKIFESTRKKTNCQLVMLGSFATDDPEGQKIFEKLEKNIEKSPFSKDIKIIAIENDFLVNCLQKASSVVIQKSTKEGFGLTVSEALYKGTPVVASKIGGIPLQVINGVNGFLHEPLDYKGFSKSVITLLENEKLRAEFGKNGKEHVKNNFLTTRLVLDWLDLFNEKFKAKKV